MDIPQLSIDMASAKTAQGVQLGMLKRAMEQMEQTGEQLTEMINSAVVSADSIIDLKV